MCLGSGKNWMGIRVRGIVSLWHGATMFSRGWDNDRGTLKSCPVDAPKQTRVDSIRIGIKEDTNIKTINIHKLKFIICHLITKASPSPCTPFLLCLTFHHLRPLSSFFILCVAVRPFPFHFSLLFHILPSSSFLILFLSSSPYPFLS